MKTYQPKEEEIKRKHYLLDAKKFKLGRLATRIARLLRGKDKPLFTPRIDCGDHVVIINSKKVKVTGRKKEEKMYYQHSGYIGSLKRDSLGELLEKNPEKVIKLAVKRMLPDNRLRPKQMKRLKVFSGKDHPYSKGDFEKVENPKAD